MEHKANESVASLLAGGVDGRQDIKLGCAALVVKTVAKTLLS